MVSHTNFQRAGQKIALLGFAPKAGDNVPVPQRSFSEHGEEIDTAVFEQRAERIREHN